MRILYDDASHQPRWSTFPMKIIGATFIVLALLSTSLSAAEGEDARLVAFFKAFLEEDFRQRPLEATRQGDHRFDNQLDDLSPKARAASIEQARKTLEELPKQVTCDKLSRGGQIDYEILRQNLTRTVW